MGNVNDSLSEVFDIEIENPDFEKPTELEQISPIQQCGNIVAQQQTLPAEFVERSKEEEDFEFARENLRDLAEKGRNLLTKITEVAESSEHPRAFEVAAQTLKTLAEVNKDILNLRKTHKENKNIGGNNATPSETTPQQINVDKAVFVGTPAQLIERRKQKNGNR